MVDELPPSNPSEKGRVLNSRSSQFKMIEPVDPEWNSDPLSRNTRFFRDVFAFSQDEELFIAHSTTRHEWPLPDSDLDSLEPVKIEKDHVFPRFDPECFNEAPDPLPADCYVKRQRLTSYDFDDPIALRRLSYLVEREARACELFKKSPHDNIAVYHGCVVEEGRIVGLCFQKYGETLQARAQGKRLLGDKESLLQGIRSAVNHIHGQGYCHNDIHDLNIMFTEKGGPILVDFDSCLPEGEVLAWKGGAPGWSMEESRFSARSNDEYSLKKLEDYLDDAYNRQGEESSESSTASDGETDGETADDD